MKKWLDEINQLDPKNPGAWPLPIKLAACALLFLAILIALYFIVYQGQLEALEKEQKKEADLKTTFIDKKKLAVNLEAYIQQRAEIQASFGALLKMLPTKSEVPALIVDISQAGLGRGLLFDLFKPSVTENMTEFYAETPIALKVSGNYHDLGAFASDISKLPRIVLLNDLKIDNSKDSGLIMEATAKTYRYLDQDEIEAQRKSKKDAEKAKTGGK